MFDRLVRQGILTTVVTLIICVVGVVAALGIPVQMIPDLEVRTITIRTTWPGATPQDVEKEILVEQEEYLRSIPSMQRMVTRASSGQARVELEFPYDVDITQTLIRVNNALNQVPDYPLNVDQPRVYATSFSSNSFMYFRVSPVDGNPRGLDMDMMRDFVDDNVRARMENVPDVARVGIGGGAERQIRVLLDPRALAERDISIADVREAVRARNRDTSGGEIESGKRRYLLRTVGRFEDLEDLQNLIVRRQGDAVVRLHEVAEVRFDHSEVTEVSTVNGQPVIGLSVRREAGSNVIDIKYAMLDEMEAINEEVLKPNGMVMELTAEDAGYVEASIRNVWINVALGATLATIVMYAFLRSWRATGVGVMGIPICTVAAFIGLLLTGRTVNVISLAGVAFAIGMTLDNTIVVLESINLERKRGLDRMKAAVEGVRRVWPAVVASTFTTIMVFVPIVFIDLEAGQLYSDVAIAISASILASMLVAITLVPTASAHMDVRGKGLGGGTEKGAEGGVMGRTVAGVDWLIRGRLRRLVVIGVSVAASAFVYIVLTPPAEYLPEGEEPKTFVRMNAPPGYNLDTMTAIGKELEDHFLQFVGDDPARYAEGEAEVPALEYLNLSIEASGLRIITETTDPDQLGDLMEVMTARFEDYPGMRAFASRGSIITSNDGGTRSVNLDISGPDLADVYAVASAAYQRAEEVFDDPRLRATPSTLSLSQPLVEVYPDWERAAELGLEAGDLGFTVAALTDGAFVDEFFRADDKIDIYFYSEAGVRADLDDLGQVPLVTPQGSVVPLATVARIAETVDTSTIRRIDGRRTVTLNVIPPPDVPLEVGVQRVREDLVGHLRETGQVPAIVAIDISGASDQLEATQAALLDNYGIAVAIVYLLLVAIFRHWGYPLLIMTTIPLGAAGGIVGLQLLNLIGGMLPLIGFQAIHQPFDMISMMGFLILMGTVVNNPILIVHRAMENVRDPETSPHEAVREAVASRLRPIVMSTITTICGLAPLVFVPGEGTELYRGVGAIVLFGILGAAVVSLTFLPAMTTIALGLRDTGPVAAAASLVARRRS
ncbi:Acriflavin resistance protein [Caenispirillum salinarum AK4]|uniref:Acriflavin resistance protein n=1 Tax=Caenispirillum salinarum AK4 TaxID=1238182 RepID=K9HH91_9PROT|nr:efflux RND transporter permease subunit [Caenispirillum salinarum]EKV29798.1 Acriflavin resistance protein [Caenispirillum salinarum AK4]